MGGSFRTIRRESGFTLLELLIAVAIFGLIGLAGYRLLNSVVNTYQQTSARTEAFSQLQKVVTLVEQDIRHMVSRSVRDELGDAIPAVSVNYRGGLPIEFTRAGRWRFPEEQYSDLLRIAYRIQNQELQRLIWPVLDRAEDTQPQVQILLKEVSGLNIRVLGDDSGWNTTWPIANNQGQIDFSLLPRAVDISLQTKTQGQIQRLITLDGL